MKVYILRHGRADWPDWQESDDERPLTKKGKKEMRRIAAFLSDLQVEPDVVISSPLPRAYQTAEIVAGELDREVIEDPILRPGFDPTELGGLLGRYRGQDVMLVGHDPGLTAAIQALTGASVKLAKAGLACIDLDQSGDLHGQLIWLITPGIVTGK